MARQIKNKAIDGLLREKDLDEVGLFKDSNGFYVEGLTDFAQDVLSHVDSTYITRHYQTDLPIKNLSDMSPEGWYRSIDYIWYKGLQEYEKELKSGSEVPQYFDSISRYLNLVEDDLLDFDRPTNFDIGALCDILSFAIGETKFSKKDRQYYRTQAYNYSNQHQGESTAPFYWDKFQGQWIAKTDGGKWFDLGEIVDHKFRGIRYQIVDRTKVLLDGLSKEEWDRIHLLYK